jgi:CDP-diacylglycerol--serine O-phosphatidyltransferase
MRNALRSQVPNMMTFASLFFACTSIILSIQGYMVTAALCILVGSLLDALDGATARQLGVSSPFGLQLDSLVDTVTFGIAPVVLVYRHMQALDFDLTLTWIAATAYVVSGVFRLARFNLLPPKDSSHRDSLGLTISFSGAVVVLVVLSNDTHGSTLLPAFFFPLLMLGLAMLMVSRIRYPAIGVLIQRRRLALAGLITIALLSLLFSPQLVILVAALLYILFGLGRAIYRLIPVGTLA